VTSSEILLLRTLKLAILVEGFYGFSLSLQANAGIVLQIRPRLFQATSFQMYCSLSILQLSAVQFQQLIAVDSSKQDSECMFIMPVLLLFFILLMLLLQVFLFLVLVLRYQNLPH